MRPIGVVLYLAAVWTSSVSAQNGLATRPTLPAAYKLQPGDELQISALDIAELNALVKVRPDGQISLLLLHEVQAAGRTVPELQNLLTESYAKFYRNPRMSVAVKSFEERTVYVTGEVAKPGAIPLAPGMMAVQAITKAGGLNPTSKSDDAVVIRQIDKETPRTIKLHISDVLQSGEPDIPLQPGDVIYVPKSDIKVYVGGEVTKPGMLPLDGRFTAMTAVMNAGGFTNNASPKNAFLLRDSGDHKAQVVKLHLDAVLKGGSDVELKPYDVVFVPKSSIAKLDRVIDQYIRGLLPATLTGGFSYLFGGGIVH
jgi:polysaccharide export outer membrane protein